MVNSSNIREDGRSSETGLAHLAVRLGFPKAQRDPEAFFSPKKGLNMRIFNMGAYCGNIMGIISYMYIYICVYIYIYI